MNEYIERTDNFIASLGVEAYRVGGSVRDELLGRKVKDADYMIRGVDLFDLGQVLRRALSRGYAKASLSPLSLRDGRQGGWRVSARGLGLIEIMLPRTERPRELSPEEKFQGGGVRRAFDIVVDPDVTVYEDATRRDFTFNALYKVISHPDGLRTLGVLDDGKATLVENVLDPTERGLYDLSHRLVTTTHWTSFRDDPLRTLRALRFVSVLGYDLSSTARTQMEEFGGSVTGLSAKGHASGTVANELSRLLMGSEPAKALRIARDTGVLAAVLPELAPMLGFAQKSKYHDLTTCEHTFSALDTAAKTDAPERVRWSLLFHDSGKPESAWDDEDGHRHFYAAPDGSTEDHEVISERIWFAAAKRLNVERRLMLDVAALTRNHMVTLEGKFKASKVRRMRVQFGDDMLRDLLMHRACDISGKERGINPNFLARLATMEAVRAEAQANDVPATVRDLEIDGNDLIAMGIEGREIGRTLGLLLDEVVSQPNTKLRSREWQMDRAQAIAAESLVTA